jgi:UDPglucose 6-dehydrogenase
MKVVVIGTGFVGVVSAGVFASFGNDVIGLDVDERKVASLNEGKVPFFEPGLEELLRSGLQAGKLRFTTDYGQAIPHSQVIIIAVGTPSAPDGTADLTYVRMAAESCAPLLSAGAIVCVKSTVPPGTLTDLQQRMTALTPQPFTLASLPEFLREGSAVKDTLHPDRVVIGCLDEGARAVLRELHAPFNAPFIEVSPESAQMGKYAANAYLATRISFVNQMADLCEKNGADVGEVIKIIGADNRIGSHYWYPGLGYGGSCFPKDVRELAAYSRTIGYGQNLFNKIHDLNSERVYVKLEQFSALVGGWSGKKVAVLGLSFKPNTDDMREAPSTKVIPQLLHEGALVRGFDPMAKEAAARLFGDQSSLQLVETIDEAVREADIVMALIEWPAIVNYDFGDGRGRWFIDARDQFSAEKLVQQGWQYIGIGRKVLS